MMPTRTLMSGSVVFRTQQPRGIDQVLDKLIAEKLLEAFQKLTYGEFVVTFLCWWMDETDEAIAKALETTVRTVRAHCCSARCKIRAFAKWAALEIGTSGGAAGEGRSVPGTGEVTV